MQARDPDLAAELLESLPDPVIGCDADGAVVYWNPAAAAAYGYAREEVLGRRAATLLHTRFPAPLLEITEELGDLGHWEGRLEHRCKDGRLVAVQSRWVARYDAAGTVLGSVAVEREVGFVDAGLPSATATPGLRTGDPEARALAHELNNALAVIVNYTAFVTAELGASTDASGASVRADLAEVAAAAERALEVTRRLAGEV